MRCFNVYSPKSSAYQQLKGIMVRCMRFVGDCSEVVFHRLQPNVTSQRYFGILYFLCCIGRVGGCHKVVIQHPATRPLNAFLAGQIQSSEVSQDSTLYWYYGFTGYCHVNWWFAIHRPSMLLNLLSELVSTSNTIYQHTLDGQRNLLCLL
jgi:hypothetical protein